MRGSSDDLDGLLARFEALVVRVLHSVAAGAARLLGGTEADVHPHAVSLDDLGVIRGQWSWHLDEEVLPALGAVFERAASATAGVLDAAGRDVVGLSSPDAAAFLHAARNRLVGVGDDLWSAARDGLMEGTRLGEGITELTARVRDASGVAEPRARVIARTEALSAQNAASLAQVRLLGDPTVIKEWLATPGRVDGCSARTRPTHCAADGQRVPIGERFQVGAAHLDFPGDPLGPPDEVISCRCSVAYVFDDEPVTASAGSEPTMSNSVQPVDSAPLTAAAEVMTGAMVALIPTAADAARLAVEGGEPVEQLHCTLLYLGDAADIPAEARAAIVDAVRSYVDGWPPVQADGFAVSVFNPGDASDRETCIVLGLSGDDLDMVHDMVGEAVYDVAAEPAGFTLPEQHAPWHAHLSLIYTDDAGRVAALTDRVGPLTFDRVRVVFAGDATDIPLDAPHPDEVAAEPADEGEPVAASVTFAGRMPAKLQAYWIKRLAPWGHGSFQRCVRLLGRHYPNDPKGACANLHKTATGRWPGSDHENHGEITMDAATLPADPPSVPDDIPAECPDGQHLDPDSGECVPDSEVPVAQVEHFAAIMHVEGVTTGFRVFEPGALTWREPPFALHWQRGSSAHNGTPETVQVGCVTRVERDGDSIHGYGRLDLGCPEGVDYARRLVEGFARWVSIGLDESLKDSDVEYVWPDGGGDGGDDADAGLAELFGEPESMIFHAGRIAELTAVSIPAQAEAVIEPTPALLDAMAAMGVMPEVADAAGPIVAAGHTIEIPDVPPAWWFNEPIETPLGALTVTDDGRLYGWVAPANVAHVSFRDRRVTVPLERVDFSRWMKGETIVAGGGRVVSGSITMDCGHLPPHASSDPAVRIKHYDDACSVVATAATGIRPGVGQWIAGALVPGLDANRLVRLMSCALSGDWPPHRERPGWTEFVASLVVPGPGFPMARTAPSVRVQEGVLVASVVPVRLVHAGDDAAPVADLRPALERVARTIGRDASTILSGLHARVHAGSNHGRG